MSCLFRGYRHRVYYANMLMHYRCKRCGALWHRRPWFLVTHAEWGKE